MSSKKVLLTGGNGFIAAHLISLLLAHNHQVTTTVRSDAKTTYLKKKFASAVEAGQLKFAIVPDITSLRVQHHGRHKDLLDPAILGTTEILKGVKAHAPTVKCVVITSSFASMVDRSQGNRPGYAYSEKDWNPVTYEEAQKDPKPGFDLTTICPPMVYGPALQEITSMSSLNTSSAAFYAIFSGQKKELANASIWFWTDVRNVAQAHVAAFCIMLGKTWNCE
ncbi:NADPH-dependent methylglyoxal reductase GRE2 protein [Ceratobasidium sp. AG-Ba]|nr:NADPH-dependent methylglyoxal reductase GRE2 protein [Ceratobasidium sp. AG-Ba]